jgi:hypothetical protein
LIVINYDFTKYIHKIDFMNVIVRDAFTQEVNDVAALNIDAYQEYSYALTADNWKIMRTSLSNVAKIAQQGQLIVAQNDRELLVGAVIYYPPGASDSLGIRYWRYTLNLVELLSN